MRFQATILLGGKTATGIRVPPDVVAALGSGKRSAVRVTINGYTYRTTVAPLGGEFMLPVSGEVRDRAGVAAGDEVAIEIELDTEPRDVTVPADLRAALNTDPAASRCFDTLSYSNQLRHVLQVEGTKNPETRQRRLEKVISTLREGTP